MAYPSNDNKGAKNLVDFVVHLRDAEDAFGGVVNKAKEDIAELIGAVQGIDDTSISKTGVWSSEKVSTEVAASNVAAQAAHNAADAAQASANAAQARADKGVADAATAKGVADKSASDLAAEVSRAVAAEQAASNAAAVAQRAADSKAPISHATSETTYGMGSSSLYGHVKLSDNTASTSSASSGVAATPKAVKAVKDAVDAAQASANAAQTRADKGVADAATAKGVADKAASDLAAEVARAVAAEQAASNAAAVAQQAADSKAPISHAASGTTYGRGSSSLYGHVKLSDSTTSSSAASSGVAATPKAVKAVMDAVSAETTRATTAEQNALEVAEEAKMRAVPVGTILYTASPTPPAGYLICNGGIVGRQTYPDLFAAIGETYGAGDGSTTFQLPNLMDRVAWGGTGVGTVKEAGLPNITGDAAGVLYSKYFSLTSALNTSDYLDRSVNNNWRTFTDETDAGVVNLNFNASRSSNVYGKSDTVQPPALTLLPVIKAFGQTVNAGDLDASLLAAEVARKEEIVESGEGWVRFASGLQFCWGIDVSVLNVCDIAFQKPFNSPPIVQLGSSFNGAEGCYYARLAMAQNEWFRYVKHNIVNGIGGNFATSDGFSICYLAFGSWK